MRLKIVLLLIVIFGCTSLNSQSQSLQEVDYLIKGGLVYDGNNTEPVRTDIGISGDKIVFIGNSATLKAKKVIDASGLIVVPGFIDQHTHCIYALSSEDAHERANLSYLAQGVTTILTGNDGFGTVDTKDELDKWQKNGIGTNAGLFVGFGSVRKEVLGVKPVEPSPKELGMMKKLVSSSMTEGAFGISTGLSYIPQTYSKTPEIIELSKVASSYGGVYDTHMRNQGTGSLKSIEETLDIAREASIPVNISHIKCSGPAAWGLSTSMIEMINQARAAGIKITASEYPYLASGDALKILIPNWAKREGNTKMLHYFNNKDTLSKIYKGIKHKLAAMGGPDKIVLSPSSVSVLSGKSVKELAGMWKISSEEAVVRALKMQPSQSVHSFVMNEDDLVRFMTQPWVMTASDGVNGHPRETGTFVKKIRHYSIDTKTISLSFAIYSSTGLPAKTFGIEKRGFIKKGDFADIAIFNPKQIKAGSSYNEPHKLAIGVDYVWVNGQLSIDRGIYTGVLAGNALKKNVK